MMLKLLKKAVPSLAFSYIKHYLKKHQLKDINELIGSLANYLRLKSQVVHDLANKAILRDKDCERLIKWINQQYKPAYKP